MPRTLFTKRHNVKMTEDMTTALRRIARWRDVSEAETIRAVCDVAFRREYDLRGIAYPHTPTPQLPGQLEMVESGWQADRHGAGGMGDTGPTSAQGGADGHA